MKKVLAIFCGRKGGTSEVIAKTALSAVKDEGLEVECVNVMDLDIRPCINCMACTRKLVEDEGNFPCPLDGDDVLWLDEKVLSSDGLIFVAPMYEKAIPGKMKLLFDRWGPSHDVTFQKAAYDRRKAKGIDPSIDERWFKNRPAAILTHGGSEWSFLSFPTLGTPCVSLGLSVVSRVQFDWAVTILTDGRLEKAYEAGAQVVANIGLAPEEMSYIGDEGQCPFCHNDVFKILKDTDKAICTLCGAPGIIHLEDGKTVMHFEENARSVSHMFDSGRTIHLQDLQENGMKMMKMDRKLLMERKKEAIDWLEVTKPDR